MFDTTDLLFCINAKNQADIDMWRKEHNILPAISFGGETERQKQITVMFPRIQLQHFHTLPKTAF